MSRVLPTRPRSSHIARRASHACAAAAGVLAAAALVTGALAAGQVVAEVGSRQVTLDDLRSELQQERASGTAATISRSLTAAGRAEAVDRLIARQLMAEAATREGLAADPGVKARIDRAVSNILAAEYEQRIAQMADTSEAALRAYYDAHQAEFQGPPRVRARQMLFKTRADAEAARADLLAGADFIALAKQRSVDPYSRENGGDLGWISAGTMVQSFEEALFALKPGEISEVVESNYGFHLIRVDDVQPAAVRAFALVRDEIRDRVLKGALAESTSALKKQFTVKVYPEALKALER